MAQSPNTQEVKNPFTEGNQQSAGEQRGEGAQAPGSEDNKGASGAAYESAKEVAGKLGTEDGKTRKEVETGSK